MSATLTVDEVRKHNSKESCWVIIRDKVYDVSEFLPEHPGGSAIILKYGGRDATKAYEPIHPKGMLEQHLPPDKHLGSLSKESIDELKAELDGVEKTEDEIRVERELKMRPPLNRMLSCQDLENVARKVLSFKALSYYLSAGDDETTARLNEEYWSRFFFIPRVLRSVSDCDPSTKILGFESAVPFFVSAAALAKLGHPLGEVNITRGCTTLTPPLIQMVSTNASCSLEELSSARRSPSQVQFFQFYKHRDDAQAEALLRRAEDLGYKAVFLTVDAIVAGNRERDIRSGWVQEEKEREAKRMKEHAMGESGGVGLVDAPATRGEEEYKDEKEEVGGLAGALLATADLTMSWEKTIPWIRKTTKLPLVIKGVQSVRDAVLAAEAGVDGILISNHGGRQLNYSMPTIEVLYRLRKQRPDVFDKCEVFVDGGVRRGTDVLKALCLGAKAVGMGRPFLFAQSAYGEAGVIKLIRILEKEIVTGMRLLGARNVGELVPEMVEKVDFRVKL